MSKKISYLSIAFSPKSWLAWVKHWHSLPVLSWLAGAHYFREGDYELASRHYLKGLRAHSRHRAASCARLDYAYCLYRLGKWMEAKEELQELVCGDTKLKLAYLLLAKIELLTSQPNSAIRVLESCLKFFPDDVQVITRLAHAMTEAGDIEDSFDYIRAMLARLKSRLPIDDPQTTPVDTAICTVELARGNLAYAQHLLSRVLAAENAPIEASLLKAELLLQCARVVQARKLAVRVMYEAPRDPRAPLLIARSYLSPPNLSEPTWAVQMAEIACRLTFWQNTKCMETLACAYKMAGREDSSELLIERTMVLQQVKEINLETIKEIENSVKLLQDIDLVHTKVLIN